LPLLRRVSRFDYDVQGHDQEQQRYKPPHHRLLWRAQLRYAVVYADGMLAFYMTR
jgi:hypothetical protein